MEGSPIVLIGPRGAGKSTLGRGLAAAAGRRFFDSDEQLALEHGAAGAGELLAALGIRSFRALERIQVAKLLHAAQRPEGGTAPVLALGGGAILEPETRVDLQRLAAVRGAAVLHVTASVAERVARQRAASDGPLRPSFTDLPLADETVALDCLRTPLYAAAATQGFDSGRDGAERALARLLRALDAGAGGA